MAKKSAAAKAAFKAENQRWNKETSSIQGGYQTALSAVDAARLQVGMRAAEKSGAHTLATMIRGVEEAKANQVRTAGTAAEIINRYGGVYSKSGAIAFNPAMVQAKTGVNIANTGARVANIQLQTTQGIGGIVKNGAIAAKAAAEQAITLAASARQVAADQAHYDAIAALKAQAMADAADMALQKQQQKADAEAAAALAGTPESEKATVRSLMETLPGTVAKAQKYIMELVNSGEDPLTLPPATLALAIGATQSQIDAATSPEFELAKIMLNNPQTTGDYLTQEERGDYIWMVTKKLYGDVVEKLNPASMKAMRKVMLANLETAKGTSASAQDQAESGSGGSGGAPSDVAVPDVWGHSSLLGFAKLDKTTMKELETGKLWDDPAGYLGAGKYDPLGTMNMLNPFGTSKSSEQSQVAESMGAYKILHNELHTAKDLFEYYKKLALASGADYNNNEKGAETWAWDRVKTVARILETSDEGLTATELALFKKTLPTGFSWGN